MNDKYVTPLLTIIFIFRRAKCSEGCCGGDAKTQSPLRFQTVANQERNCSDQRASQPLFLKHSARESESITGNRLCMTYIKPASSHSPTPQTCINDA